MRSSEIVVIGTTHHNTLSILRSLGKRFGPVMMVLIGNDDSYILGSRYIKHSEVLNDAEELPDFLLKNAGIYSDSIVISCSDSISQIIDSSRRLDGYADLFKCKTPGMLSSMMDKQVQIEKARMYGLKVPESAVYKSGDEIPEFDYFPCIVKPDKSFSGGKSLHICNNSEELRNLLCNFGKDSEVQIQRMISKEYEIVVPGAVSSGKVFMPGYIHKFREQVGATTYSAVKRHDNSTMEISGNLNRLLSDIGYEGLFGAEFIFDGNDYYFIELNLRNDATTYSFDAAGTSIVEYYVRNKRGENYDNETLPEEIRSIVEFNDFTNVLNRRVSLSRWLKDKRSAVCRYYYDRDDKKPYYKALSYWLGNWTFKKIFR